MKTYRAIHEGIKKLISLPGHDRAWVAAKLRVSASPEEAVAASRLFKFVVPRKRSISVFLSHNSIDKPFARSVYRYLEKNGLRVWLDEAELNGGDSLITALADAVYRVDCVVAVISQASVSSKWVKKELAWAMSREIKGRRVYVIPIRKDSAKLPNALSDKVYLDFSTAYKRTKNKAQLLSSILSQVRPKPPRHF